MREKYGKDGLVVLAVNLDQPPAGAAKRAKLLADVADRLKRQQADLPCLVLDEDLATRQGRLHFAAPPCVYVFSRRGQWRRFGGEDAPLDEAELEAFVAGQVAEK